MNALGHSLAQFNIARTRAPLDDPSMHGFVSQLDAVNAVADRAPGFVWRLQTAAGDATALRPYGDDRVIVNMSVWESLEALQAYVYGGAHASVLRDRRQWFERLEAPVMVLWWIARGHVPTVGEGMERLDQLTRLGPTERAFTFRAPFPAPGGPAVVPRPIDAAFCDRP